MNLAERWKMGPDQIWKMPVDQVLLGVHYAKFMAEFDETVAHLNKHQK